MVIVVLHQHQSSHHDANTVELCFILQLENWKQRHFCSV